MSIVIKEYSRDYLTGTMHVWNEVVDAGNAFPQLDLLDHETADPFFQEQTYTGIAVDESTDEVMGLYILHPNNVGRCGHIANASYAVDSKYRGKHIGEMLVKDCLLQAKNHGFDLMQFNAVVDNNIHARHLYARLGFQEVGTIPKGFRMKDGHFEDIHVMYKELV